MVMGVNSNKFGNTIVVYILQIEDSIRDAEMVTSKRGN
jgi:hypothetical protein